MKKSFKRLLSCIFVITFFLIGMCLDRARVNIPEVDSFSVSEAKVFATPKASVSDTMPCTTEMLGLVRNQSPILQQTEAVPAMYYAYSNSYFAVCVQLSVSVSISNRQA